MLRSSAWRSVVYVLASAGLWAQSLSMPPSTVTRGASGSLLLTLESPEGKAPLALQWEFTFPPNVVVDVADIVAGSAAESAQKAITCRAVAEITGCRSRLCVCLYSCRRPETDSKWSDCRGSVPGSYGDSPDSGEGPRRESHWGNGRLTQSRVRRHTSCDQCEVGFWPVACFSCPVNDERTTNQPVRRRCAECGNPDSGVQPVPAGPGSTIPEAGNGPARKKGLRAGGPGISKCNQG